MENKKSLSLVLVLFCFLCLNQGCQNITREREVDKSRLRGYDYRRFQGTEGWEIAKAVWDDDKKAIKQLLNKNKDLVNTSDPVSHRTLLMYTIGNQQYSTFKYLLELGADPDLHDSYDGASAIIQACEMANDNTEYLEQLIKYGANVNDVEVGKRRADNNTRFTPLMASCRNGKLEEVKLLVQAGADLNYQNEYGKSALSQAMTQAQYDIVLFLLTKGVDPAIPLLERKHENRTLFIQDMLREDLFELNSPMHKKKMEIVSVLSKKGIDYKKAPIPEFIVKKIKERYPNSWEEYLDKY